MASWKKVCHLTADSGAPWNLLMVQKCWHVALYPSLGFAANTNDQRSAEAVRFCCSTWCKRHLDYRRVLDESICMYLQRRPGQFEVGQWQVQESHCLLAGQNIRNESWMSISVFFLSVQQIDQISRQLKWLAILDHFGKLMIVDGFFTGDFMDFPCWISSNSSISRRAAGWLRTLSVEAFIGSDQGGEGVKLLGVKQQTWWHNIV